MGRIYFEKSASDTHLKSDGERLTDSQSTHEDYNLPRSTAVDRVTYLIACSSVKVSCNAWGHPARTKISKIVPKALAAPLSRSTSL
jgi:hypothetical protein